VNSCLRRNSLSLGGKPSPKPPGTTGYYFFPAGEKMLSAPAGRLLFASGQSSFSLAPCLRAGFAPLLSPWPLGQDLSLHSLLSLSLLSLGFFVLVSHLGLNEERY